MPGGVIEPLPRNLTDTTRVLLRLPGAKGVANHPLTGELAGQLLEAALPIRRFYSLPAVDDAVDSLQNGLTKLRAESNPELQC